MPKAKDSPTKTPKPKEEAKEPITPETRNAIVTSVRKAKLLANIEVIGVIQSIDNLTEKQGKKLIQAIRRLNSVRTLEYVASPRMAIDKLKEVKDSGALIEED